MVKHNLQANQIHNTNHVIDWEVEYFRKLQNRPGGIPVFLLYHTSEIDKTSLCARKWKYTI